MGLKDNIKQIVVGVYSRCLANKIVGPLAHGARNSYRAIRGRNYIPYDGAIITVDRGISSEGSPVGSAAAVVIAMRTASEIAAAKAVVADFVTRLGPDAGSHPVLSYLKERDRIARGAISLDSAAGHDDHLVRFHAGCIFAADGATQRAYEVFRSIVDSPPPRQLIERFPSYATAFARATEFVGQALERQQRPADALELYRRVLSLVQTSPAIAARAARIALRAGRLKEAAELSKGVLTAEPHHL